MAVWWGGVGCGGIGCGRVVWGRFFSFFADSFFCRFFLPPFFLYADLIWMGFFPFFFADFFAWLCLFPCPSLPPCPCLPLPLPLPLPSSLPLPRPCLWHGTVSSMGRKSPLTHESNFAQYHNITKILSFYRVSPASPISPYHLKFFNHSTIRKAFISESCSTQIEMIGRKT